MPVPYTEAVDDVVVQAADKATTLKSPIRYAVQSLLAGAYVGVAIVLLASVGGPLVAGGSAAAKLVEGAIFGVALTLVVFAGAELFTSNNMTMLIGWLRGGVSATAAIAVNVASLIGNFVGSVAFAGLVHESGVLGVHAPGKPAPGNALIASLVAGKEAASGSQLFWRAVLCNMLVCLGIWMATRTRSDGAKLAVLWWALFAFVASGFEHSVANMTVFALAIYNGAAGWGDLFHNLLYTVPGNVVGGAIVIGLPYAFSTKVTRRPERPRVSAPIPAEDHAGAVA